MSQHRPLTGATTSTTTAPDPTAEPAPAATGVGASPRILVLGGTGLMGREVLGALRRRGATARVLVDRKSVV